MNYYAVERSTFLTHHGILGQKWGVRRFQNKDGSLTSAGKKRYTSKELAEKAHDEAVRRMNVTHTKTGDEEVDAEQDAYFKKIDRQHPIEKLSEIERYDSSADVKNLRSQINSDPSANGGREYNCPNCSAAFEMTERGYSVTARPKMDGSNVENIESFFEGGKLTACRGAETLYERHGFVEAYNKMNRLEKVKNFTGIKGPYKKAKRECWNLRTKTCEEVKNKTLKELSKQGNGARGIMVVGWCDSVNPSKRASQYHAFNYKVEDGKPVFYDAQSHRPAKQNGGVTHQFFYDADPRDVYYMRTDNLNLSENITSAVYSNKRKGAA